MTRNVLVAALAAGLALAGAAVAGEPTERVRGIIDQVLAIQNDPALQGSQHEDRRTTDIKRVIGQSFTFSAMARQSLGREWDRLSPAQRQEFTELLQDLFQDSYSKLVLNFLKRETIRYGAESATGDTATVKTVIQRLAREQIPVDYRLAQAGGNWAIVDVVIDGVSIVDNYRSQFTKIIRTMSYDALVKKMKIRREEIPAAQR
jgi:phospholipid transport system substrate-binding protein